VTARPVRKERDEAATNRGPREGRAQKEQEDEAERRREREPYVAGAFPAGSLPPVSRLP